MKDRIFQRLNDWIGEYNEEASDEGFRELPHCYLNIVGQYGLNLASEKMYKVTDDIDLFKEEIPYSVKEQLSIIAAESGLEIEALSKEIWMPEETEFMQYFQEMFLTVKVAKPIYIIVSKARAGRAKDVDSITRFLIANPKQKHRFSELVKKYSIDLNFLKQGISE